MEKSEKCPASSRLQPILLLLCVSPLPRCRPFGREEIGKAADIRTSTGQDQLCEACPKAFQQASDRLHSVAVGTAGCQRAYPVPVDVLRKTSAAGMQPACHFAKFQPVFHVPLLSYPLPDEFRFRIILKGAAAYIRENKTKQCGTTACLPVLHKYSPVEAETAGTGLCCLS